LHVHDDHKEIDRLSWLMLIASVAGPLRSSVTAQRQLNLPQINTTVQLASNAQTHVLFVSVRSPTPGVGQQSVLIGRSYNLSPATSTSVDLANFPFEYNLILLPGEQVFIQRTTPAPGAVLVAEAAFQ
jgi:hypothetical protein